MATKTIAWTTGSGNITLTYTGQGNGSISVSSDENDSFEERSQSFDIVTTNGTPEQAVSILVKQKGKSYPVGEVFNFAYTGSVQQITLPKGKYKLQCWGAQGGNVTGTYAVNGSKGGYSEGVITLTKTTTLYVFVGGQGTSYTSSASQTSTSVVNGGWNGGGAGVRTSRYNSGNTNGRSFPRGGGGATDISTVTSDMSYSSGRTNRSSASLLARCIVAGGGAGASARYSIVTTTETQTSETYLGSFSSKNASYPDGGIYYSSTDRTFYAFNAPSGLAVGDVITLKGSMSDFYQFQLNYASSSGSSKTVSSSASNPKITVPSDFGTFRYWTVVFTNDKTASYTHSSVASSFSLYKVTSTSTTTTSNSNGKSNQSQQGGGTSGKGQYPGTQTSAGSGGAFGLGANQATTGDRYCSGGGGGGWYGGGKASSDSSTSYINYSGGGSGFVNIAVNASSRPSGYTGLQLDSGTTTAGSSSFPSTSGGTETGHSGNGYARITVID